MTNLNVLISTQVTQLFSPKWFNFFSQFPERKNWVIFTKKVESLAEQKLYPNFYVKLTQFFAKCTKRKIESFWPKSWVAGGTKIWSNFLGQNGSIWLSMLSQFDFQYWVNLTLNAELIWLSMLIQYDSLCWANVTLLTLNVELIWLLMLSQFDSKNFQLLTFPGQIVVLPVTQLFVSKWLNFFLCVS